MTNRLVKQLNVEVCLIPCMGISNLFNHYQSDRTDSGSMKLIFNPIITSVISVTSHLLNGLPVARLLVLVPLHGGCLELRASQPVHDATCQKWSDSVTGMPNILPPAGLFRIATTILPA